MVEDVLAGGEDREHRRRHAGDLAHEGGRARAHLDAELGFEAVAVEEERLPAVVVGDLDLVLGDVLEVRELLALLEQPLGLLADDLPVALDVRHPVEALEREEGGVADERAPPDETLDRREDPFADRDRQLDGALPRRLGHARLLSWLARPAHRPRSAAHPSETVGRASPGLNPRSGGYFPRSRPGGTRVRGARDRGTEGVVRGRKGAARARSRGGRRERGRTSRRPRSCLTDDLTRESQAIRGRRKRGVLRTRATEDEEARRLSCVRSGGLAQRG